MKPNKNVKKNRNRVNAVFTLQRTRSRRGWPRRPKIRLAHPGFRKVTTTVSGGRGGTTLVEAGTKAAVYGFRHLVHNSDYYLQRGLAAPDKVALVLTHRCNCRCVMCDLWRAGDTRHELPAERWM